MELLKTKINWQKLGDIDNKQVKIGKLNKINC